MSTTDDRYSQGRTLASMLKGLVSDVSILFRQEIELAKTEVTERVESAVHGGQILVVGAILSMGALGVLLAAIVLLGQAVLVNLGLDEMTANIVSAAIVGVVVGGLGWMMISAGVKRLKTSTFNLERTTHSLSEDANMVKERL